MTVDRVFYGRLAVLLILVPLSSSIARADACTTGCQKEQNTCMDQVAHHNGTAQGCVAEFKTCKAECTPAPKPFPKVTDVGDSCAAAICSAPHLACYDRHCACEPGFVACGTKCVDVVSDEHSCGACGVSCNKGREMLCRRVPCGKTRTTDAERVQSWRAVRCDAGKLLWVREPPRALRQ